MIAMLMRARLHVDWTCPATARVTRTAAVASATTRRNAITDRYGGESPTTVMSDLAPERPSSKSSCARTRDMRKIAASAAESRNATTMLTSAGSANCGNISVSRPRSDARAVARGEERQEQLPLQLEHLALLVRLGVVVAEQVQDAVRRQQEHLLDRGVPRLDRLLRGHRRAQHDVAERALLGLLALAAGPQLVHGEAHDVGRPGQVHPLHVEDLHGGLVDELDAEVGLRVHPHLLHDVLGAGQQLELVDVGVGLVEDVDAHAPASRASPA